MPNDKARSGLTRSPVIIISAHKLDASDEDLKPAVILEKPFHVAELLDMVDIVGSALGAAPPSDIEQDVLVFAKHVRDRLDEICQELSRLQAETQKQQTDLKRSADDITAMQEAVEELEGEKSTVDSK